MTIPLVLTRLMIRLGVARFLPGVRRRLGGDGRFLRYFSDHLLTAPLTTLEQAADLMEQIAPEVIDLTPGAPRFDLTPSGGSKLPADRRGWPAAGGLADLRAAVAEKLLADNRLAFNPAEEVLITDGALGAVHVALEAFVNPGDRVVLMDPSSPLHSLAARGRGARVHFLPTWTEDGRTRFHDDELAKALNGAQMLIVTSPANPTGTVLSAEDLERIAWWAERRDVLILSDEVFERYRHEGDAVSIGMLDRARRRTLTAGSVSKGHALAAACVGWLAGCRPLLLACRAAAAMRSPFVPTLCQQVALAALRTGADAFAPVLAEFESRRRYVFDRLRSIDLEPAWPAGAFFVWLPVWKLGLSGREFTAGLLDEKDVLVTPGDLFGPSGPGYIRISYAGDDGRLHEGIQRLTEYVLGLQGVQPAQPLRLAA